MVRVKIKGTACCLYIVYAVVTRSNTVVTTSCMQYNCLAVVYIYEGSYWGKLKLAPHLSHPYEKIIVVMYVSLYVVVRRPCAPQTIVHVHNISR